MPAYEMGAHGLEEHVLEVTEREVEEGALLVGLPAVGFPLPRCLLGVRLEACKLVDLHQRGLDDILDLGLVLVEERVRDVLNLLVGVGGHQKEPLAVLAVLPLEHLA